MNRTFSHGTTSNHKPNLPPDISSNREPNHQPGMQFESWNFILGISLNHEPKPRNSSEPWTEPPSLFSPTSTSRKKQRKTPTFTVERGHQCCGRVEIVLPVKFLDSAASVTGSGVACCAMCALARCSADDRPTADGRRTEDSRQPRAWSCHNVQHVCPSSLASHRRRLRLQPCPAGCVPGQRFCAAIKGFVTCELLLKIQQSSGNLHCIDVAIGIGIGIALCMSHASPGRRSCRSRRHSCFNSSSAPNKDLPQPH